MAEPYVSGDALFAFDASLTVVAWNEEVARLTGIAPDDAIGRPCWDVLRGISLRGDIVCHPGCSAARLALEGWPVPCRRMMIRTSSGRKPVSVSTVCVQREAGGPTVLNLLRNGNGVEPTRKAARRLTARQVEVLQLLAEGQPAKVVAGRLRIGETTARNHIAAILRRLGCHSQLEAVAEARRLELI